MNYDFGGDRHQKVPPRGGRAPYGEREARERVQVPLLAPLKGPKPLDFGPFNMLRSGT